MLDPGPRKTPDAERLLAHELALDNATFRLIDAAPAWTRYLVLDFRFTAVSEEKREGILRLAINLATGAMLGRDAGPDGVVGPPQGDLTATDSALPPPMWCCRKTGTRARVVERVQRALPWRVEAALAPFAMGLRRRLARDLDRLHAYHNDLHREASLRAAQLAASDAGRQRESPAHRRDRAGVSRQAGRPRAQIRAARHGGLGADAGAGDAGAPADRADPPPQGGADDGAGLEHAYAPAGAAALRGGLVDRAAAPGVRRCAASCRAGGTGAVCRLRPRILPSLPPATLPEMRPCRSGFGVPRGRDTARRRCGGPVGADGAAAAFSACRCGRDDGLIR